MSFRLSDSDNSVLLVVDFQKSFRDILSQAKRTEAAVIRSIQMADLFGVPTIVTEQYPAGLGETTEPVRNALNQSSQTVGTKAKDSFSCCGDPDFTGLLEETVAEIRGSSESPPPPTEIVICGIETHVCVLTTALELKQSGYRVTVLEDAVSSREQFYKENGITQLRDAGVRVNNTETIGFEWAGDKDHESFKDMSNLLKQTLPAG